MKKKEKWLWRCLTRLFMLTYLMLLLYIYKHFWFRLACPNYFVHLRAIDLPSLFYINIAFEIFECTAQIEYCSYTVRYKWSSFRGERIGTICRSSACASVRLSHTDAFFIQNPAFFILLFHYGRNRKYFLLFFNTEWRFLYKMGSLWAWLKFDSRSI